MKIRHLLLIIAMFPLWLFAQQPMGVVSGRIADNDGEALEFVNIYVSGMTNYGTVSDVKGKYSLNVPADTTISIVYTFIGYRKYTIECRLSKNEKRKLDVSLMSDDINLNDVVVEGRQIETGSIARLNPKEAALLPTSSGSGVEDLIKTQIGVSSTNEMSSQYNVRGGSFDENLVYVNGIEIYRPFLVGSGKQEGLSFINSKLVDNIVFSAGGFAAEYGDKLSSVLDVTYRKPTSFASSIAMSFLGCEAHTEGISNSHRFSYILGARYKNTQYILDAMNTQGTYKPNFTDVQGLFNFDLSEKLKLSVLGYYSRNHYLMVPKTGIVTYGAYQASYRCNIYYEGQEVDNYVTGLGAASLEYTPRNNVNLKFIASGYSADESETYDILGEYYIGEMNSSDDESQVHNPVSALGVGGYLKHARNYYYGSVVSLDHKGSVVYNDKNVLKWGLRYQRQFVDNMINEWKLVDSTGYTLPYSGALGTTPEALTVSNISKSDTILTINNFDGYIQNTWTFESEQGEFLITGGLRFNRWGYNGESKASPRVGFAFKPNGKTNITFRLSGGVYHQLPTFRELQNMDGSIIQPGNAHIQQSYQVVAGSDLCFHAWERPFVFTTEVYYKYLDRITPYVVDNIRIRYYADRMANGYATGLDMKIYGEFVKGIDSWASLSILSTKEDILGDYILVDSSGSQLPTNANPSLIADTLSVGLIPRPSDQRVNFSLFFQDYIPNYPSFKVNLKLVFGTSLIYREPFKEPNNYFRDGHPYRRVDIGFSKQLVDGKNSFKEGSPLNHVKSCWLSLEVFNLLNVRNVVSYTWVTDTSGIQHGVPEYLTPRQINLKLVAEF